MHAPDRRRFLTAAVPALAAAWVASRAHALGAASGAVGAELSKALWRIDAASRALTAGEASPAQWQDAVAEAASAIELGDLLAAIDFHRLSAEAGFAEAGVATVPARLPDVFGDGGRPAFYAKVFAVGKGRAVIPHGHANMVSGHLVLDGSFRLRQYDRVGDQDGAMLIRPTVDRIETAGGLSTISDERDNVHWLVAEADAHTLDFIVTGVDPAAAKNFDIQNIDVLAATDLGGDVLAAPYLGVSAALAKYG